MPTTPTQAELDAEWAALELDHTTLAGWQEILAIRARINEIRRHVGWPLWRSGGVGSLCASDPDPGGEHLSEFELGVDNAYDRQLAVPGWSPPTE